MAPGTDHTLYLLTDRERRPPNPFRELSPEMLEFVSAVPFALDDKRFAKNWRVIPQEGSYEWVFARGLLGRGWSAPGVS